MTNIRVHESESVYNSESRARRSILRRVRVRLLAGGKNMNEPTHGGRECGGVKPGTRRGLGGGAAG